MVTSSGPSTILLPSSTIARATLAESAMSAIDTEPYIGTRLAFAEGCVAAVGSGVCISLRDSVDLEFGGSGSDMGVL